MATISSPRPSFSQQSTTSSRRTSLDTTSDAPTTTRPTPRERRNRTALRDYYNIAPASPSAASTTATITAEEEPDSELDRPGFDAEEYVRGVLEREGLDGVLKVEGRLLGEIRGLDGEKKSLVYDNYSKLIGATDMIKKMRTNMDPLTPTLATLGPAVSHIAETAAALSTQLAERVSQQSPANQLRDEDHKDKQRQTVQWVLDSPRRLEELVREGKTDLAKSDWAEIEQLLDKWQDVKGVDAIRDACQRALAGGDSSAIEET